MAIKSGFFKSVNGDRKYQAEFFASYFASFIGNGVFPNPSNNLQVLAFQNMQTRVSVGKAWINGYYLLNDEDITITHAPADGVLRRVDRIVVGLNFDSRQMNIYLKQGTPGTNAVAPTLTRNATVYELALADVSILPGNTVITQSAITDQRLNNALCGIVHGVVDQVDTTSLYQQYQSSLEEFERVSEAEFRAWYNSLQVILDGNVAANLSARIIQLENSLNNFGGRNYLYRSLDIEGYEGHNGAGYSTGIDEKTGYRYFRATKIVENTNNQIGVRQKSTYYRTKLIDGIPYVLSFMARSNANTYPGFTIYNTSGANSSYRPIKPIFNANWTRYEFNFTLNRTGSLDSVLSGLLISVPRTEMQLGQYFDVANIKIEKGTIATDYVPNYEDSILTLASQQEAQQGVNNTNYMTPLRTKQLGDNYYLSKTGGTLTGNVSINNSSPSLSLASPNGSNKIEFVNVANDVDDYGFDIVRKGQVVMRINPDGISNFLDTDGGFISLPSLKQSVSNGKALVAAAVTGKGVPTAADATFQTIATNVSQINTGINYRFGTVTSNNTLVDFINIDNTNVVTAHQVTISNIGFLPRSVKLFTVYGVDNTWEAIEYDLTVRNGAIRSYDLITGRPIGLINSNYAPVVINANSIVFPVTLANTQYTYKIYGE